VRRGINARNLKPRSPEGDLHRRSGEKSLTVGSSRRADCNFRSSAVGRMGCVVAQTPEARCSKKRVDVVGSDDVASIPPCGILCEQG
jgi:hypothetical protein